MRPLGDTLRLSTRTAAFVGLSLSMSAMFELELASVRGRVPREAIVAKWTRRYGRALLRLYGVELLAAGPHVSSGGRYPGRDASGLGRLFLMNHRSGLDVPICLTVADATLVSRHDLASWPVIGHVARQAGTLFVDRDSRKSGASVQKEMARALGEGRGILLYPEGTTHAGDEVRPFRPGAFQIAKRVGCEIVPLGIAYEGAAAAYLDESFAEHMMRVSAAPRTRAAVVAGEPIVGPHTSSRELSSRVHEAIQSLVDRARAMLGG